MKIELSLLSLLVVACCFFAFGPSLSAPPKSAPLEATAIEPDRLPLEGGRRAQVIVTPSLHDYTQPSVEVSLRPTL
jgi:hypothetical protein